MQAISKKYNRTPKLECDIEIYVKVLHLLLEIVMTGTTGTWKFQSYWVYIRANTGHLDGDVSP